MKRGREKEGHVFGGFLKTGAGKKVDQVAIRVEDGLGSLSIRVDDMEKWNGRGALNSIGKKIKKNQDKGRDTKTGLLFT